MIGFAIGVASVLGLRALYRHKHGCGYADFDDGSFERGRRRGYREGRRSRWYRHRRHRGPRYRRAMWLLFERLDTTPGQEKVIREQVHLIYEQTQDLRASGLATGGDLAELMDQENIDSAAVNDVLGKGENELGELRRSVAEAMAKIHEVLDPEQRKRLAAWMRRGPLGRG